MSDYNLYCERCGCDYGADRPHKPECDRQTGAEAAIAAFCESRWFYVVLAVSLAVCATIAACAIL